MLTAESLTFYNGTLILTPPCVTLFLFCTSTYAAEDDLGRLIGHVALRVRYRFQQKIDAIQLEGLCYPGFVSVHWKSLIPTDEQLGVVHCVLCAVHFHQPDAGRASYRHSADHMIDWSNTCVHDACPLLARLVTLVLSDQIQC